MQVTELKNEGLKREFKITLKAEDISKQVDDRISHIAKQLKVPGFRPGKVPFSIVKKRHGREALGEILESAVKNTSNEIIRERNLLPALEPKIEVASFTEGADLIYNLSFEVYPEVPEFDFSKIKLSRPKVQISDEDIEESLERLQKSRKQFKPLDTQRAAKDGDAVVIDFVGSINGEKFAGGTASGYRLELGSGSFIPGFEEQLKGSKKGSHVKVEVTFPENYGSANLAGKEAVFEVTVHEVLQSSIPEADDEFAKSIGFDDIAKLKEAISIQIESDFEKLAKVKMKKDLFDKLDKDLTFEVPEGMVEMEYNSLLQSEKENGSKEEYKELSRRRVKLGILLADIGKGNSIKVTEEELKRALFDQVRNFPGQEQRVIEFYQKNKGALENLGGPILEEKVVDLIISKSSVTDKKTSTKDLLEFQD